MNACQPARWKRCTRQSRGDQGSVCWSRARYVLTDGALDFGKPSPDYLAMNAPTLQSIAMR